MNRVVSISRITVSLTVLDIECQMGPFDDDQIKRIENERSAVYRLLLRHSPVRAV